MLELVIFDADGVLFDSSESNTAYYNAIFARVSAGCMMASVHSVLCARGRATRSC